MASLKKNAKDHRAKRNLGSAEFFKKQRKERNAARGKQVWVPDVYIPANTGVNGMDVPIQSTSGQWERQ